MEATARAAGDSLIAVDLPLKKSGGLDLSHKGVMQAVSTVIDALPDEFICGQYSCGLNIAGNGIYTLDKSNISQDDIDLFVCAVGKALQDKGETVYLFSDRDAVGVDKMGKDLFKSFATDARYNAWANCVKGTPSKLKYVIVEWRWEIPGRNDEATKILEQYNYDISITNQAYNRFLKIVAKQAGITAAPSALW